MPILLFLETLPCSSGGKTTVTTPPPKKLCARISFAFFTVKLYSPPGHPPGDK